MTDSLRELGFDEELLLLQRLERDLDHPEELVEGVERCGGELTEAKSRRRPRNLTLTQHHLSSFAVRS